MRMCRWMRAALALAGTGTAAAQSFNLDLGTGAGVPGAGFGGPAEQAGFWNEIQGGQTSYPLMDLDGNATFASIESFGFFGDPNHPFVNPQPATQFDPDVAALLDDFFFFSGDVQTEVAIYGLQNGWYDLVVTGILVGAPDEPTVFTWLSDDLSEFQEDWTGDEEYTGQWVQSVTHAKFRVPVTNNELRFTATGVFNLDIESFGNINGLQLVFVPEPTTALMCLPVLMILRRR